MHRPTPSKRLYEPAVRSGAALMCVALAFALAAPGARAGDAWPEFRGPTGQGHAEAENLPLRWSDSRNVAWKTRIHDSGWSSPVVMGDQVWLTTATEDGTKMYAIAVDRQSGRIVHDIHLWDVADPRPLGNPVNGYASPSPVIEPGRVYVHFGSYGTACIDTDSGEVLWKRRDLECNHFRGPGSSPVLFRETLILTMDGIDKQYTVALDKKTGQTVWRTPRTTEWNDLNAEGEPKANGDFRKAYSTPLILESSGRLQMLSPGAKAAYSYDPRTGEELWHISHEGFSAASRPVAARGLALLNTGYPRAKLLAVRTDGTGDVTDSHIEWVLRRGAPNRSSPLIVDGRVYMVDDDGVASCLELETGDVVWRERLPGQYSASPVYADGRLYFFNQAGTATVLAPSRSFELLAENKLDKGFMASPAVAGNAFYLRTKTHLYSVERRADASER